MKRDGVGMEQGEYLKAAKARLSVERISAILEDISRLKVLVIGDAIIDEYVFTHPKGRAVKDPILSVEFKYEERYAGGALAVANHVANFAGQVELVTILGDTRSNLDFIKGSLNGRIKLKAFTKAGSHTTVKRRYIDQYRNNKLFKIEYMDDRPISRELTGQIIDFLGPELPKYDLVIVADFGHGFINGSIRKALRAGARFLAVNTQSNSSNMGYNYFTLYDKPDFLSLAEEELRLPLSRRFDDIEDVIREAYQRHGMANFLVTLGKRGCAYCHKGNILKAPVFTSTVTDTVGAGDAVFSLVSLFVCSKAEDELIPFVANCAGGISVNIMGNKESITREKLVGFMEEKLV